MVDQNLIDWIKKQEAKGHSPQKLYKILIENGYNPEQAGEALIQVANEMANSE